MTGSGVLVRALWRAAIFAGDNHRLICAGYPDDDWSSHFGAAYGMVTCTDTVPGEVKFPVPGMSDVMPYAASRYSDLRPTDIDEFLNAFRHHMHRMLEEFDPDLLHIHHLWVLTELASAYNGPCVVTVHGTDLRQARSAAQHRSRVVESLPHVRHIFCVSKDMADDARKEYGLPASRISIVGNGFDGEIFDMDGPNHRRHRKLVLCAGKFVAWKGFKYAIRASARVDLPHDLVILGDGPAAARESLQQEAKRFGVDVSLPGHVDHENVATWLRSADVFLLPSVHEPFGLVLLEAMACGCRIVASESGGPRDIVSPTLVNQHLATLVAPLTGSSADAEHKYVDDLAAALRFQLAQETTPTTRAVVSATVADMTWNSTYTDIRQTYLSLLSRP